MEHLLFQVSGLEPSAQFSLVGGDMIDQPIVPEIVETAPDVPFQNPFGALSSAQCEKATGHRILRRALLAETVGAPVGQRLRHRVQRKQLQGLFGPVGLNGNAEGAAFSFLLGDVDPSERLWLVILRIQLLGLSPLLRGCFQHDAVDARRMFALIGADPLHREELGGERAGEQALQTPHAVPLACPDRLHDTGL